MPPCDSFSCPTNNTFDLDPGEEAKYIPLGRRRRGSRSESCRVAFCPENYCGWYAYECPDNQPLYSSNRVCPTYNGQLDPAAYLTPGSKPATGDLVTDEDLDYLMRSISGEFNSARWVITDVSELIPPIADELIQAGDFNALKTFLENVIDRMSHDYDFFSTGGFTGNLSPTSGYNVSGTYVGLVEASDIQELCDLIDQIRTDCICVNNCDCYGYCKCNWNCGCNY